MAPFVVTAGSRALLVGSAAGVGPVRAELEAGGAAVDVLAPAALSEWGGCHVASGADRGAALAWRLCEPPCVERGSCG